MRTPEKLAMREAFALAAIEMADQVPNMVVLDADVSKSTKSTMFAQAHPQRFLNIGIAEQNMVAIAAGLAAAGMVPVVNTFSMLLSMRALDQVRQSVAYPRLNVKIMGHYAGYSAGNEGASHHAIEDMGIIRTIPNMTLIAPCDVTEAKEAFKASVLYDGPVYLRLSRNPVPQVFESPRPFRIGEGYEMRAGSDLTFVTTGIMLTRALDAAEELARRGIEARVVAMPTVKPLDRALVERAARETGAIVTVEEHNIINGLGSAVAEALVETVPVPMERVGIADVFAESGDFFELLDKYGMGVPNLVAAAERVLRRKAGA